MQTIKDAVAILEAQQKPLAEKLKKIETDYKTEREAILVQLKPLNKALKMLTTKPAKAPKLVADKPAKPAQLAASEPKPEKAVADAK